MRKPVLSAPVGNRILVIDGPESLQLTSVRGDDPVTVDPAGLIGTFNWSPAGDRLVGGITQKEPNKIGFAVIDAQTGAISKHWIDHDRYDCSRCDFTWTRNGQEVAMPIADRSGGEAEERVSDLQLFNADTGEPTMSLPITDLPTGPFAWSPGGRYVVVGPAGTSEGWRLYDTTTGQQRPFPYPAVWVTADVLLATKDGKVLTLTPDGAVTATIEVARPTRARSPSDRRGKAKKQRPKAKGKSGQSSGIRYFQRPLDRILRCHGGHQGPVPGRVQVAGQQPVERPRLAAGQDRAG